MTFVHKTLAVAIGVTGLAFAVALGMRLHDAWNSNLAQGSGQ